MTDRFFGKGEKFSLTDVYEEVFHWEDEMVEVLKKDVTQRYQMAQESFDDAPEDAKEFLQYFSFICLLSFDVYMKKQLIEKLIDDLAQKKEKKEKKEPKESKKAKEKQSKES